MTGAGARRMSHTKRQLAIAAQEFTIDAASWSCQRGGNRQPRVYRAGAFMLPSH